MPLPDALPDRRIYELLKTVDLENLTFSDFQKVAQTIYAEQGAEDELRRIVLLNLARLSVAGEWSGLTSAGGAGGQTLISSTTINGTGTSYNTTYNVAGTVARSTVAAQSIVGSVFIVPFVAPRSATVASLTLDVSTADGEADVGFYNVTDDGGVGTLIGKATIDCTSTGLRTQSTLSATVTFEKGKTYWLGFVKSSGSGTLNVWSANDGYAPLGVDRSNINNAAPNLYYAPTFGSATSLPAGPFTSTSDWLTIGRTQIPIVGILWS